MLNDDIKNILDVFYDEYTSKANSLTKLLSKTYKVSWEYTTKYTKEVYPLPVIHVSNLCDIILGEYEIDINTKISKANILKLNFNGFKKYDFDIYSEYDYFNDLYEKGMSTDELIKKIKKKNYKNYGFTFIVPLDMPNASIRNLINLISKNNFKY